MEGTIFLFQSKVMIYNDKPHYSIDLTLVSCIIIFIKIDTMKHTWLKKYDVPAPRYTSYPTVPYWQTTAPTASEWKQRLLTTYQKDNTISLYIHLPFCESLCTYCGCNKRITKNHGMEAPYIDAVLQEWQLYLELFPTPPIVQEIHLGGGTPTFFAPEALDKLMHGIFDKVKKAKNFEGSFEAHPSSTTTPHLAILKKHGFNRISIGVQDFDEVILKIINRHQTFDQVMSVTTEARAMGYTSINYDLIFGLPLQTPANIIQNMEYVRTLRPERIAFYSYAHVPWVMPSQRAYSEKDLPLSNDKRALYNLGKAMLEEMGYIEIGMDHFALATDTLCKAQQSGTLHRNFMGYTTNSTNINLALGVSAISDSGNAYIQNVKRVETYQEIVNNGEFPILRGHLLTESDEILRYHIQNLMCNFKTSWFDYHFQCLELYEGFARLRAFEQDGLLKRVPYKMSITEAGKPYIRNICMAIDARYWSNQPSTPIFSKAI